jgi:asparagine synthase (glutamine-hydrolysing)
MARLIREAAAWARLRHRPAHAVITSAVRLAFTSSPRALIRLAEQARRGAGLPPRRGVEDLLCWFSFSPALAWAQPETRAMLADQIAATAQDRDPALAATGDAAALRLVHGDGTARRPYAQLAAGWGVDLHTPYLDKLLAGSSGPLAALADVIAAEVWLRTLRRPRPALWSAHAREAHHA